MPARLMQIGLIGCGQHGSRAGSRAGAARCCARPGRRARARRWPRRSAGEALAQQRRGGRSAPISSCSATSPPSCARSRARSRRSARAVASILAATPLAALQAGLPGSPGLPLHPLAAGRGAPGRGRAGRRHRRRAEDADGDALDAAGRASCSPSWARSSCCPTSSLDVAMGLMSCAPGVRGAGRRGAGRRGRAPGHPGRAGRQLVVQTLAGTAELLRRRGNDTVGGAPRGDLAGRRDRARAATRSSAPALRGAFSDALDAVLGDAGARCMPRPGQRARADRRIPVDADLRLHPADHPLHRRSSCCSRSGCARRTRARSTRCSASCATSANRSCASSAACCRRSAGIDLSPILAIITLEMINAWSSSGSSMADVAACAAPLSAMRSTATRPDGTARRRSRRGARSRGARPLAGRGRLVSCVVAIDQLTKHAVEQLDLAGEERSCCRACELVQHAQPAAWPSGFLPGSHVGVTILIGVALRAAARVLRAPRRRSR